LIVVSSRLAHCGRVFGATGLLLRWVMLIALTTSFLGVLNAPAAAAHEPCPMAQSMDCADMSADPCCDHELPGQSDTGNSCKSGMPCQVSATAPALPAEAAAVVMMTFVHTDSAPSVSHAPASHPPDRRLRPPILL
jgi:hypothetical protein